MYYENFDNLCRINNIKPNKVSKDTGIATSTLSSWKKGVYTPKQDKLQLIAEYFNVSVDYLLKKNDYEIVIEYAEKDVILSNSDARLKEYALKLSKLSEDKQQQIMNLIDMLEDKGE